MQALEFIAAVALLLGTPGPTNTLLALAGYLRGPARAAPLLAGELLGYLTVIVPVATLAAPLLDQHPAVLPAVKLAAAAWVAVLAVRLWRSPHAAADGSEIGVGRVFLTTLLNPKAPIIALLIMPHGPIGQIAPWLAAFGVMVPLAGGCWILAGATLSRAAGAMIGDRAIRRVAAVCLAGFSTVLAASSVGALS